MTKTILIIGTYDTKDTELRFLEGVIVEQGGKVRTMDVSVLHDPVEPTDLSKHDVAAAGNSSIADAIALDDENAAMQVMSLGASRLTSDMHSRGEIDGVIILGGSMGTDLALDVCLSLPLGGNRSFETALAMTCQFA